MTDYQCTCTTTDFMGYSAVDYGGCILHDPKLKGSLLICQRLDKLIEVLTHKA